MAFFSKDDTFVSPVAKYCLFFTNLIFWLAGGTIFGIGLWGFLEKNKFNHVNISSVYDVLFDLSIVFMVIGAVMFILACSGCIGALRENTCLLKFFYIVMIIIFLLELTCAILAFVFKDPAKKYVQDTLQFNYITRYEDDPDAKSFIDFIQEEFSCCGVSPNGYRDWNANMYYNCSSENKSRLKCAVPHSCCKTQDTITAGVPNIMCGASSLDSSANNIYTTGCVDRMLYLAEANLPVVGGVILGLMVPQILGICLARMLEGQIVDQMARWRRQRLLEEHQ